MFINEKISNLIVGILFLVGILFISYSVFYGVPIVFSFIIILFLLKGNKRLIMTITAFLIGFSLYRYSGLLIEHTIKSNEGRIILNRLSLLFVIGSLVVVSRLYKHPFRYMNKPEWHNKIYFPFIWRGFHSLKISTFLIVAILINALVFMPFIFSQDGAYLRDLIMIAIFFTFINAILEELLWRGFLLSHFKECVNDYYALIFTSIGFGLQHISIGIPLVPSFLFSFGGIFFAGVVMRANSIYPSIIWHIVLNFGMVFSGFILK
ncbi:MAG: CPBP family intramembrane glutamic endopeptidase [Bacillota bacterium]